MYWFAFKLLSIWTGDVRVYSVTAQIITPDAEPLGWYGNASMRLAVSSESWDTYTAIGMLHAERGLIWKDDIIPFLYQFLPFAAPKSPSLSILYCNGRRTWNHDAANVVTPYERKLWTCCKHAHFLINGPWCGDMFLQGWPQNISVFSGIIFWRRWNPACCLVWSSAIHWFHIRMTVNGDRQARRAISRKDNLQSR